MKKKKLILKEKIQENENTKTLVFQTADGLKIDFLAGQYLHLFIGGESKMYTLSSAPYEKDIRISIKAGKNFSLKLHQLNLGDEIEYLGPLGFLTFEEMEDEQKEKEIVMLSAGIGITPFHSMIQEEAHRGFHKNIQLLYANKNREQTLFYDAFQSLENTFPQFHVHHFWSEDGNKLDAGKLQNFIDNEKIYMICGPTAFVEDFWKILKDAGIDENNIFTESFFAQ